VGRSGGAADGASDFTRAGEGDLVDVGMFHERFAGRAVAGDNVHYAGRQAHFVTDLREGESGERRKLGGLQDHCVAGGQGRSDFPGQHEQRKIPGDDLADDTQGLVARKLRF